MDNTDRRMLIIIACILFYWFIFDGVEVSVLAKIIYSIVWFMIFVVAELIHMSKK